MKQGITLQDMAATLQAQIASKRDYLADTRNIGLNDVGQLYMEGRDSEFPLTKIAHNQVAQRVKIPQAYYDRMLQEAPKLLARNVNHWFDNNPEKRMIRTLNGQVRAFLSDIYHPRDNVDLVEWALPAITQAGCQIQSCALTESHMYIKAVTPRIASEIKRGDIVQAGISIANSEVGHGSLRVEPLIFRLVCLNGMISSSAIRKYHVGRRFDTEGNVQELLSDEARIADDKAFWLMVRDVIQGALTQVVFDKLVENMRIATENLIEHKPMETVEITSKRFQLTNDETEGVLEHLIQGGDLSQYGLANAVTRASQDIENYDRATELERIGGQIIELSKKEWQEIN